MTRIFAATLLLLLMGATKCGDGDQNTTIRCDEGGVPQTVALCSSTDSAEDTESNDIECEKAQPQFVSCGGTLVNIEENDIEGISTGRAKRVKRFVIELEL